MLLVSLAALLTVQTSASTPVSGRPDLLTSWSSWEGEPVLHLYFEGSSHWIRGFGITPFDDVAVEAEDMNDDGQTDVTVRVQTPEGRTLHHILLTDALPPLLDLAAGPAFVSLISDEDGFGFGPGGELCTFFDHGEPEDVGVFDKEIQGFEIDAWSHDVSVFAPSLTGSALVTLEIREMFSEDSFDSKLVVESTKAFSFERAGSDCGSGDCFTCALGTVHVYAGVLDDLSSFLDGAVSVDFEEGGDDIALDWSRLTIQPL